MSSKKISRKDFFKFTVLGAAGVAFTVDPLLAVTNTRAEAAPRPVAPSDTITIAGIGMGVQGQNVIKGMLAFRNVRVLAACDVYDIKRAASQKLIDDYYAAKDIPGKVALYENFEDVINRKDIDAVVIATPDHWHALIAVAACQTGKDVFVEKPQTSTIFEGKQLVKAVRQYKRVLQTGSMQRSMDTFQHAVKIVQSGALGKITKIYARVGDPPRDIDYEKQPVPQGLNWDKWLGPLADTYYYNEKLVPKDNGFGSWRWYKGLGGGYTTDWGAHHFDIAQWAIGKDGSGPVTVMPPETSPHGVLTYIYDNGIELIQKRDEDNLDGLKIIGEKGWVNANRGSYYCSNKEWSREGRDDTQVPKGTTGPGGGMPPQGALGQGRPPQGAPGQGRPPQGAPGQGLTTTGADGRQVVRGQSQDGFEINDKHYADFLECIISRKDPIADVEVGHSSSNLCNIGNIAYDLRRTLKWDPVKEEFINDSEANNHYIMRYNMRKPYQIDNI